MELKGPLPLRGFLLYPANGSFVGVPRDYADKVRLTTDCPGVAALTHKTPAPAVSIRGYWQAPVKGANSTIRATVMPMPLGQGPVYIFSQTLLPLSDGEGRRGTPLGAEVVKRQLVTHKPAVFLAVL